jgi:hypothetical protein
LKSSPGINAICFENRLGAGKNVSTGREIFLDRIKPTKAIDSLHSPFSGHQRPLSSISAGFPTGTAFASTGRVHVFFWLGERMRAGFRQG